MLYDVKLSIIVPVFNLEQYIYNCIESILNQSYKDYELILINDGSTDNSGNICEIYAEKEQRIRVFHQDNSGVSIARNLGLSNARGEWICFVDGDDCLEMGALEKIMTNPYLIDVPEVIIARSFLLNNKKSIGTERYPYDDSLTNHFHSGRDLFVNQNYKRGSVCGCIFNKAFLDKHHLKFPCGIMNGEDSIFSSMYYIYSKKILFLDVHLYNVFERPGSASRDWDKKKIYNLFINLEFINVFLNENNNGLLSWQKNMLYLNVLGIISKMYNGLYDCFTIKDFLHISKKIKKTNNAKLDAGSLKMYKSRVNVLNYSVCLFGTLILLKRLIKL